MHSDGSALPANARAPYQAARGDKELVWGDGDHWDYYDSPRQVDNAVTNVARFFSAHLV